ncbi:MAG: hypothetical protein HYX72_14015 [Acidobacteria bacterium]|nr:hypothetical protein [Acidobacteriota bacterium]
MNVLRRRGRLFSLITQGFPYQQRYRKNIPYGWVKKHGTLLMTLTDGEVEFPKLQIERPAAAATEHVDESPEETDK